VINVILFVVVSRKAVHQMSQDLPESKITTMTIDKQIFKYLSQTTPDLFAFEKSC